MTPIARWHIGSVRPAGFECLRISIDSFLKFYSAEVIICFNCEESQINEWNNRATLFNQLDYKNCNNPPLGVAWKLYPPRLDINRKEIVIDNDIVFEERIPEIDQFFNEDITLLTEDHTRCYGQFENHVPMMFQINSGIYGMPEGFDLKNYVDFYGRHGWEENAKGTNAASKTFDEQGLIATALLNYKKVVIIPQQTLTNCEQTLVLSKGMHFIGLNRCSFHRPFQEYKASKRRLYL